MFVGPRYTVFLRRSADVTAEQLRAGVAEGLRIVSARTNDDAFADVAARIDVEANGPAFVVRDGDDRIYVLRCPSDALAHAVAETIAELPPALSMHGPLRDHLGATVDMFVASFGVSSARSAALIAANVVRWLARDYDGMIYGAMGNWYSLGDRHQFVEIANEPAS